METKSRTISKIVIWRVLTLCVTVSVLQVYTNNFFLSSTIGIIDHSICLVLHYFYERFWGKYTWGIIDNDNNNENLEIQTTVV